MGDRQPAHIMLSDFQNLLSALDPNAFEHFVVDIPKTAPTTLIAVPMPTVVRARI